MAETKKKKQIETSMALPIGTILRGGQYQYCIEEVLGQGNYGITYKASAMIAHGNISQLWYFAIKENFAKEYCSRETNGITMTYSQNRAEEAERDLREFVAEGKTLAKICNGNENIINVNEYFEANNTAYYVMEFIEGGDLRTLVKSKGRLSETEAINLITPIIDAVGYLHRNRRLHLDINPENIVLKKDRTPILIDFGVTLHFNADGSRTGTSKLKSGGFSWGYAPMEQYLGVNSFAPEVDVYALGATLYFMLVGKDPEKASEINPKKVEANLPTNISQQTRTAILHAMKKLAESRTPTADVFKLELITNKSKNVSGEEYIDTVHEIKSQLTNTAKHPYKPEPTIDKTTPENDKGASFTTRETKEGTSQNVYSLNAFISIPLAMSRVFDFKGRSSLSEFWWNIPILTILFLSCKIYSIYNGCSEQNGGIEMVLEGISVLLVFIMSSIYVRRLHDTIRTGWWALFPISFFGNCIIPFVPELIYIPFEICFASLSFLVLFFCGQDSARKQNLKALSYAISLLLMLALLIYIVWACIPSFYKTIHPMEFFVLLFN